MQMWHQGVWTGFGGASSVFDSRPRSTTAKALMINTAYRYPLTQVDRARQGWGMPLLDAMYNIRARTFIINETDALLNTESRSYTLTVAPGEPLAAFTMVYADPKGNPAAAQARINDLSLRVTSPTGVQYWGNNGLVSSNLSTPGGAANTVDTVENVFIANPQAGNWTVEVIATSLVQDGRLQTPNVSDAAFALVATGVTGPGPAPLTIELPGPLPSLIPPNTPTDITVRVIPGSQAVVPGSPKMHYRITGAGAFAEQVLTPLSGNDYRATLPPLSCSNTPQYYFSAQGSLGALVTRPQSAPAAFLSSSVGSITTTTLMDVDFENAWPAGWSATGLWHISSSCSPSGTPCGGSQAAYYGRSAQCNYDTGAANSGTLTSPPINLPNIPAGGSVSLTLCSALQTENFSGYDKAEILVNGNVVASPGESASWNTVSLDLSSFAGQTVTLGFRFDTVDGTLNTFRGWHIDRVRIASSSVSCSGSCYVNCDGSTVSPVLTANDFQCFMNKYAAADPYANCDGSSVSPVLTANDFQCFMNKYAAGCS